MPDHPSWNRRRFVFAAAAFAGTSPASIALASRQANQPETSSPQTKPPKPSTPAGKPAEKIDLASPPRFLDYRRVNGQPSSPRGLLTAIWESGRVVRCSSPDHPGIKLLTGTIDPAIITNLETAFDRIGILEPLMLKPSVVLSSSIDVLSFNSPDKVEQVLWTQPMKPRFDDWALRFYAVRDLLARVCASADTPVKNEDLLDDYVGQWTYQRIWRRFTSTPVFP